MSPEALWDKILYWFLQLCGATRKARLEQRQRIAPRSGLAASQRKALGPFELRIDHQELLWRAYGDRFWRMAQFPAEPIRRGKPNVAGRRKRLRQRFEPARLNEVGRPSLDVGLPGEP